MPKPSSVLESIPEPITGIISGPYAGFFCGGGGGGGEIQRRDGPNVRQRREPLGGKRGHAPFREILKIRLYENAFCAFWRQYDVNGQPEAKLKMRILLKLLNFGMDFLAQRLVYVCNVQS